MSEKSSGVLRSPLIHVYTYFILTVEAQRLSDLFFATNCVSAPVIGFGISLGIVMTRVIMSREISPEQQGR